MRATAISSAVCGIYLPVVVVVLGHPAYFLSIYQTRYNGISTIGTIPSVRFQTSRVSAGCVFVDECDGLVVDSRVGRRYRCKHI